MSFDRSDTPGPVRVLCVDDHRIVLDGLALLIDRQPDMEVVASATNGSDALVLFAAHRPGVTVMDLQLRGMDGIETIRRIRELSPDARVVVLTMYGGDEDVHRARDAGASAYLLKDTISTDLLGVIRAVHAGDRLIPSPETSIQADGAPHSALTRRERQTVRLLAQGFRNKQIAAALGIAEETAKVHVKHVFSKLNVHDRSAIMSVALKRGIIRSPANDAPL